MMIVDFVYRIAQYVINKEQRGNFTPAEFNVLCRAVQLEYISKRVGNIKIMNEQGVPAFGYESTWRLHEDLRPLIYGPVTIPVSPAGVFNYPYGYIWPDAIHKTDFRNIRRITADQYPQIKHSSIIPPTEDYPVVIMRGAYGFIDPYSIGQFMMSYLKCPPDPVWGYVLINDVPVFDEGISTDFSLPQLSINELALMILAHVGINLGSAEITSYSLQKDAGGT